jgi:YD repeat-containing protein
VVRSHTDSYSDAIFTFEYDEKGQIRYMLAYDAENPGADDEPFRDDLDHGYALEYTYYTSGNLKTVKITDVETGSLSYKIEFYDREDSSVQILLGEGLSPSSNQWPALDLLDFIGAKKQINYHSKYTYVTNYQENGYTDEMQVTYNDAGQVTELRYDDHAYTYTYHKSGNLKHSEYDSDTDGSSTLYDHSRNYTYQYNLLTGQLMSFSYKDENREVAECEETFTYDERGRLTAIRAERRKDASYGDDYLGWNHTFYIDSQWLDYAAAAAAPVESEGLGILQAGQLKDAMSRSFLEALKLLSGRDGARWGSCQPGGDTEHLRPLLR